MVFGVWIDFYRSLFSIMMENGMVVFDWIYMKLEHKITFTGIPRVPDGLKVPIL